HPRSLVHFGPHPNLLFPTATSNFQLPPTSAPSPWVTPSTSSPPDSDGEIMEVEMEMDDDNDGELQPLELRKTETGQRLSSNPGHYCRVIGSLGKAPLMSATAYWGVPAVTTPLVPCEPRSHPSQPYLLNHHCHHPSHPSKLLDQRRVRPKAFPGEEVAEHPERVDEEEKSSSSDEDRDLLNKKSIEEWKQQQLMTARAFYQATGRERTPMPVGEERGKVVYCIDHATKRPYFTCSRVGGSRGPIKSATSSVDQTDFTLEFESRFESGNLQKAVQVVVYDYELTLQTDLYTESTRSGSTSG
ncbi:hypothetical protein INR49_001681, partial [Caranx melampygus]